MLGLGVQPARNCVNGRVDGPAWLVRERDEGRVAFGDHAVRVAELDERKLGVDDVWVKEDLSTCANRRSAEKTRAAREQIRTWLATGLIFAEASRMVSSGMPKLLTPILL